MAAVEIQVETDAGEAASAAALIAGRALKHAVTIAEGAVFMALSGGTTPRGMYERLAAQDGTRVPWERVHALWGDERCVPPTDARSNYRMAKQTGLLDLPLAGIHRMPGELQPEEGSRDYEEELRALFPEMAFPRLDLVVLGLGDDGHTASLTPGSAALDEPRLWVRAVESYQGTPRLTLTLPVLARAAHLLFLVTGAAKARIVGEVLGPELKDCAHAPDAADSQAGPHPGASKVSVLPARALLDEVAARGQDAHGGKTAMPKVTWVMDQEAAARLPLP